MTSPPKAKLQIYLDNKIHQVVALDTEPATIGRSPQNTITLPDNPQISRQHARISYTGADYVLADLNSAQGTFINGERLLPSKEWTLGEGDWVGVGTYQLRFTCPDTSFPAAQSTPLSTEKTLISSDAQAHEPVLPPQTLDLKNRDSLTIGRDVLNDLVINHPTVSRFHSQIKRQKGSFVIFDLNSSNGTFVEGKQVQGYHPLKVGEAIRIGPCNLTFQSDQTLIHRDDAGNLTLDAVGLNKVINKEVNLLQNISLSIKAREFVVIAGVSGGGKSTLLDALNGFRPATSGHVFINGTDLYKNFNAYRTEIGYVPQRDIVHMELTVEQALDYAAQLRMPADTTPTERRTRVNEVLRDLGLTHRRTVPVKALSGGQIKRVSIGVELLTKPSLFFLDEATSGLDPGTEAELMQLLRQLADQGRTVILITHATENVTICDQVVFMAAGGNVAYYGPPQQAPQYFGVEKFNQIYRRVEHEATPEEWQQRYLNSDEYQHYIASRQRLTLDSQSSETPLETHKPLPGARVNHISGWQQFLILFRRNLSILLRDRASLVLMLAIAPVLGLLDLLAWQRNIFDAQSGNAGSVISMLFISSLIAVMVGSLATMREIVKEVDIYQRERIIGLQIIPYISSKLCLSLVLALYQSAIFLVFKIIAIDFPGGFNVLIGLYITLLLSTIAGMVMGLLGSALSPNQNVAPLIAIIFLVPQIIFGGGILPLDSLGGPGLVINRASITKWSYEALMTISEFGKDIANDRCWSLSAEERKQLTTGEKSSCGCTGPNVFKVCQFPGIGEFYDPTIDQPVLEPPQEPGDAPQAPIRPQSDSIAAQQAYQQELDHYQNEIEAYLNQVSTYQTELSDYSTWRENYEGSIGKAEGVIERFQQKYGESFAVNLSFHWIMLVVLSGGMLILIFMVQKYKD